MKYPENIIGVPGVSLGVAATGEKDKDDLVIVRFEEGSSVVGVFTNSAFAAPPVILAKARQNSCRAWIINSGNANAATGEPGMRDAEEICANLARLLSVEGESVMPFSTGVIGERLPLQLIKDATERAVMDMSGNKWLQAAEAIMTTDTVPKLVEKRFSLGNNTIVIGGMAKGSGMIRPDMATMLSFITCNVRINESLLPSLVKHVADASFNRITVDGDTSTNDAFVLACTANSDSPVIENEAQYEYAIVRDALIEVAQELAQAIVRDGEGATKFVAVNISGGITERECLEVAYSIAESPLVKTAIFAEDANWGRFCMAIGKAGVRHLDTDKITLWLDDLVVAERGRISTEYSEEKGAAVLAQEEFSVRVDLGRGEANTTIWTTDLSHDYIRINAEYRS